MNPLEGKKPHHSIYCVQIITLSDLETDMINVRQCCDKLNQVCIDSLAFPNDKNSIFQTFIPEIALHITLTVFFLLSNHWFLVLLNIPLDLWFAYKSVIAFFYSLNLLICIFKIFQTTTKSIRLL